MFFCSWLFVVVILDFFLFSILPQCFALFWVTRPISWLQSPSVLPVPLHIRLRVQVTCIIQTIVQDSVNCYSVTHNSSSSPFVFDTSVCAVLNNIRKPVKEMPGLYVKPRAVAKDLRAKTLWRSIKEMFTQVGTSVSLCFAVFLCDVHCLVLSVVHMRSTFM